MQDPKCCHAKPDNTCRFMLSIETGKPAECDGKDYACAAYYLDENAPDLKPPRCKFCNVPSPRHTYECTNPEVDE